MYCEYLLKQAKEFEEKEQELLGEFFFANYGLVFVFEKSFRVQLAEQEDFRQLCYLALVQAFHAYQAGNPNSFLSYYRRCVLHQYYVYKMEMRYCVKLSRTDFKAVEQGDIILESTDSQFNYGDLDDNLICIEQSMMASAVWGEVERALAWQDALLLKRRFCDEVTYKDLAEELELDPDTLRFKQHHLLVKLRKNVRLHKIAQDFYGIR